MILVFRSEFASNQMPGWPNEPMWIRIEITNPIYLEAQVELGGKLVISSDETHATRRLQVGLEA